MIESTAPGIRRCVFFASRSNVIGRNSWSASKPRWRSLMHRVLQQNLAVNAVINVTVLQRAPGRHGVETERGQHGIEAVPDAKSPGTLLTESIDDYLFERLHLLKIGTAAEALTVLEG